ncbi:MAG TPA: sigma-70 family RNA polymerase sigma factor [Bryobacteraceae bacterium]|jgi:RNA polymerase sigma factor (TIGR02999 family)|nr:sigma-70 family RNA polymerase sigma factor [Bryobacteraceae bacterium]
MTEPAQEDVTQLLLQVSQGNRAAVDQLLPLIYQELRRQAGAYLRRERVGHTLQPTALVHEAYLRLVDQTRVEWRNRAHFMGVAANLMRRILIDHARSHLAEKRGGEYAKISLDDMSIPIEGRSAELIAVDEALEALAKLDPAMSRLVELRYFGGLSIEETAAVMETSVATVNRQWRMAKAWLYGQLNRNSS